MIQPVAHSHKRSEQVTRDLSGLTDLTAGLTKPEAQPGQSKSDPQSAKEGKKNDPLAQLASESGLGGLFSKNSHHGLGLLPVCFA